MTLRCRGVPLRARWVMLRACWVTRISGWVPPHFRSVSGACEVSADGRCFSSPFWPLEYRPNMRCSIAVGAEVRLAVTSFETEEEFDTLLLSYVVQTQFADQTGELGLGTKEFSGIMPEELQVWYNQSCSPSSERPPHRALAASQVRRSLGRSLVFTSSRSTCVPKEQ